MNRILEVRNLGVVLEGREILRGISFDVEERENVALIGPNGAGKTILLKAILGIVPYTGEIRWGRVASVGYVPQRVDADLSVPLSVRNLLEAKASVTGRGENEIEEIITNVGLAAVGAVRLGKLSGGQLQRALIAFALLGRPDVILLDEPTASIDEPGEEQIHELIHRMQMRLPIAAIIASHDLTFVHRYADRVLCLNRSAVCFGPPQGSLSAEVLQRTFGDQAVGRHAH